MNFTSFDRARDFLIDLVKKFELDPELCSLPASITMYFGYSIKTGGEGGMEQKECFKKAIQSIKENSQSFCLLGNGRTISESSVALVENGKYLGFGYYESDRAFVRIDDVKNIITRYPDTPDAQRILNQYYSKRRIVQFETQAQAPDFGLFA